MEYQVTFDSMFDGFFFGNICFFLETDSEGHFFVLFCLLLPQKKNKCIRGKFNPSDEIMKTSGMCKLSSGLLECA